eukprot:scaffold1687_cov405-Prasinococcus_capsulatus_cf.AAC.25
MTRKAHRTVGAKPAPARAAEAEAGGDGVRQKRKAAAAIDDIFTSAKQRKQAREAEREREEEQLRKELEAKEQKEQLRAASSDAQPALSHVARQAQLQARIARLEAKQGDASKATWTDDGLGGACAGTTFVSGRRRPWSVRAPEQVLVIFVLPCSGIYNEEGWTGRKTNDGMRIFKTHVLNARAGGLTKKCPFDCNCCFI